MRPACHRAANEAAAIRTRLFVDLSMTVRLTARVHQNSPGHYKKCAVQNSTAMRTGDFCLRHAPSVPRVPAPVSRHVMSFLPGFCSHNHFNYQCNITTLLWQNFYSSISKRIRRFAGGSGTGATLGFGWSGGVGVSCATGNRIRRLDGASGIGWSGGAGSSCATGALSNLNSSTPSLSFASRGRRLATLSSSAAAAAAAFASIASFHRRLSALSCSASIA